MGKARAKGGNADAGDRAVRLPPPDRDPATVLPSQQRARFGRPRSIQKRR